MSLQLTYWKDAKRKRTPDDYDEIKTVTLKSVNEVMTKIVDRPPNCKMITMQHSYKRQLKDGRLSDFSKVIWENGKLFYNPYGSVKSSPDFDRELWIDCKETDNSFQYTFTIAKSDALATAFETLVKVANDIIAQHKRNRR